MTAGGHTHIKKLSLGKRLFFVIEKYVEDVKQGQKVAPDLVESIMRPTDIVKEQLQRKTQKMHQFRSQITKIRVCTFEMSRKITDSANVSSEPVILTPPHASAAPFSQYLAALAAKYSEKCGF